MIDIVRRRLVGFLAVLPLSAKFGIAAFGQERERDAVASDAEALSAFRALATLMEWHKSSVQTYATAAECWAWVTQNGKVDTSESLLSTARIESGEVLPGWKFQSHLTAERDNYLLLAHSQKGMLYAMDRQLLIHYGPVSGQGSIPRKFVSAGSLTSIGLVPLGNKKRSVSALSEIMRRFAFSGVAFTGFDGECPGPGTCGDASTMGPGCGVWGTGTCPVCCYNGCDTCNLYLGRLNCNQACTIT